MKEKEMRDKIISFLNFCDIIPNEDLIDNFYVFISELRHEEYEDGYKDGYDDGYSQGTFDAFSGEILDD